MSLLRPSSRIIRSTALQATRSYAAAATTQTSSSSSSPAIKVTHSTSNSSSPLLSNIEANWIGLPQEEQYEVYRKLEEIQKRDWKELTVDEKKAAYYVAYGAHGPRTPVYGANPSGSSTRVFLGTMGAIGFAFAIFLGVRGRAPPPPKSMSKESQDAMTERFKEEKLNPITGIGSEGYKGKGFSTLP